MLRRFDFSIPLSMDRLHLLITCVERHKELLYGDTAKLELNRYMLKMLAKKIYQEPKKLANAIDRHIDFILSYLSDIVFPYDSSKYDVEEESNLSELKAQYKRYIENLEKAEKEAKDVSGNG